MKNQAIMRHAMKDLELNRYAINVSFVFLKIQTEQKGDYISKSKEVEENFPVWKRVIHGTRAKMAECGYKKDRGGVEDVSGAVVCNAVEFIFTMKK